MEENNGTELEEGEASYYHEEERVDNDDIDPDVNLSYIDEKIENLLGHFQRNFDQPVISAETLGPAFGYWGSFLPTCERSPLSRRKSPDRINVSIKSPDSKSSVAILTNLPAPTATLTCSRLKGAQSNSDNLQDKKFSSGNFSVKKGNEEALVSSDPTADKPTKVETLDKPGNGSKQRTFKFWIKVGSNKNSNTNAALYSGLGLDDSSSTSLGSSSRDTSGFTSLFGEAADESPGNILQVMTSFPVPCSDLMSPLHEDLIAFVKERIFVKDYKPADHIKVSTGQKTVSMDHSGTTQGYAMQLKVKKIKSETRNEKTIGVNKGNSMDIVNNQAGLTDKEMKNQMSNGKASRRNDLEKASYSRSDNVSGEPRKMLPKGSEVFEEAFIIEAKQKLNSEPVESPAKQASDPNYGAEIKRRQSHTVLKAGGRGPSGSHGPTSQVNPSKNGTWRGEELSLYQKGRNSVANNEDEFFYRKDDFMKVISDHEGPQHEHSETSIPFQNEKPVLGRKKNSKGAGLDDKASSLRKDQSGIVPSILEKDKKGSSHDIPKKAVKLTSGKRINKLGKLADLSETFNGEQNYLETPSAGRKKDVNSTFAVENDVFAIPREINSNGTFNSSFSVAPVGGALDAIPVAPMVEMASSAASLLENWVLCDLCGRWRLLPMGIKPQDLPENWMCSMLDWLPGMNSCDIVEDVTTGMMRGLIPYPGVASTDHGNGSMFELSPNFQNVGQNPQNASTVETDVGGKSTPSSKVMLKKLKAKAVNDRSLNNMDQHPAVHNSFRRCNLLESKSQDFDFDENILKQKQKNLSIGDTKVVKAKNKRKSNQFELETHKRPKREELNNDVKRGDADAEVCRTGVSSGIPKLTIVNGKDHFDGHSSAKEVKPVREGRFRVSVKDPSPQAQVTSDGPAANLENVVKGSSSLKKRKLKGSQGDQNKGKLRHRYAENSKLVAEETGECILSKERKSRVDKSVARDLSCRDDDNSLRNKGKGTAVLSSPVVRNHFINGVKENLHSIKISKILAPKQANSSSSKISGSQKSRVNNAVQGSPVESVSSSPLRIARPDNLSQGNAVTGVFPVVENVRESSHKKVDNQNKISGAVTGKESRGSLTKSLEFGLSKGQGKLSSGFENDRRNTDYARTYTHDNGVYEKQSGTALHSEQSGNLSLVLNGKGRSSADRCKVKVLEKAGEDDKEHRNKGERQNFCQKVDDPHTFVQVEGHLHSDSDNKNSKNQTKWRASPYQNKHVDSNGQTGNHYIDFGLQSTSENTCSDSNHHMGAAPVSVEAKVVKVKMVSHLEDGKQETITRSTHFVKPRCAGKSTLIDATSNSELSKGSQKTGAYNGLERHPSEVHGAKNVLTQSPLGANQCIQSASAVLEEAEKLRDLADRLKETNFGFEGNESYFEAALKFLQGASLLETGSGESSRHGEMTPIQLYYIAAKLCGSCAAEFERCQELAAAALAYKCMDVAYMRVVYCKNPSLSRDRHELQTTLNQGESPSSSASDIDNLNNQAVADRYNLSKGAVSLAVGNHIAVARHLPCFMRLLDFTQDVHLAMEASRKSQDTFMAAYAILEESQNKEHIIISLKKVIYFNFQDIDGLLRLVQLTRDAISRSGFSSAKE